MSSNGGVGCTEDMQIETTTETNTKQGDGANERQTIPGNNTFTDIGMRYCYCKYLP